MPNVASVLREEIIRLARKEIRPLVGPLKKSNIELRRTVSALNKKVAALEKRANFLERQETRRLKSAPKPNKDKEVRFSPQWVINDRDRLGLSAKNYGLLVGVAGLTIYNWESWKARPRAKQLAAWGAVRRMGKREALRRLELLE